MATIDALLGRIERAMARYNPENDTIPNAPAVTWADYQTLDVLHDLVGILCEAQEKPGQANKAPVKDTLYTPGPWKATESGNCVYQDDEAEGLVFKENLGFVAWIVDTGKDQEQLANARLIAAAPKMLKTLQMTLVYLDTMGGHVETEAYYKIVEAVEEAIGAADPYYFAP